MIFIAISLVLLLVEGLNTICSSSICPDIKKGNHKCNPECMTSYCNYDTNVQYDSSFQKIKSDCYMRCVNEGCDPKILGNGFCDESCNTENCGHDWGDCLCAQGCLNSMLGDGKCDAACNNWNCYLDNHDCGQCADGCFPEMLGNGICDSECNNKDCLYDYNDCQCAENCTWIDYGNCNPKCMVANCNYDHVDQYPNNWCQNKSLAIFSSYQQIIRNDFSYVVHLEDCYAASNYTCSLNKALDFSKCYKECNILECNYANGNCDVLALFRCLRKIKNSTECLTCEYNPIISFFNLNRTCVPSLIWEIGLLTLLDRSFLKVPLIDTSSTKNPHVYFVNPSLSSSWKSGIGTYFSPFSSLSYALSSVLYKHSVIYLLKSDYYFETFHRVPSGILSPRNVYSSVDIFKFLSLKNIQIRPFNETSISIKRAKDDIYNVVAFWFYLTNISNLEISNVVFDWKNTISSCTNENYCDYCPVILSEPSLNTYYNDRGEKIYNFLPTAWCTINYGINFFRINSTNLVLNNVAFINFRTDFNSILYAINGSNLTLNNVTFDNIKVYNNDSSAVIVWNSTGNLQFTNGSVSRLNNGYEIKDSFRMKGFLNAIYANSIVFRNVNFAYNIVREPFVINTNRGTLLFLNLFQMFEIYSCKFIYNYCEYGIINIQQNYNDYKIEVNDNGNIVYSTLNHIHIVNSNFTSNYGKTAGAIYIYFEYESQNFLIENSSFILNGIEAGPLIYIESNYIDKKFLSDTNVNATTANNESLVEGKYLAKWVKIKNSSFIENYSGASVIFEAIKMINIDLRNNFMASNGLISSESMNFNSVILKYYIENPDLYIKLNITDPLDLNCESLLSILDSINFKIESTSIQKNYCKFSLPGIVISNTTNSTVNSSYFENNSGSGADGICLTVNEKTPLTIKDSFFISNQNYLSGSGGAISSISTLLLQNCSFYKNIADLGGALYFSGQSLSIIDSYFDSNKSPNLNGGAIYFNLALYEIANSLFFITETTFINNSCTSNGGGIFISKSSLLENKLSLSIDNTYFYNNKAYAGSSIFIDESILFSIDSSINNCIFQENKAKFSGTVWIYYADGILEFNSCNFANNSGLYSSGFNIAIGKSDKNSKLILNSCNFQFNSGNVTISLDNKNTNPTLETNYCLFEYNYGSVFSLDSTYMIDKNSRYEHNYSPNSGGILNLKNSAIFIAENAKYLNCSSNLNGGVASISLKSHYSCSSCNFTQNSAESSGGIIYADSDSNFNIQRSIINRNSCKNRGSVIFMASVSVNSSIDSTKISENYAYGEGTITLLSSIISITYSEISNNSVLEKNPGIHLENSNATIISTSFFDQNGDEGSFILLSSSSIKIINSSFHDGFSKSSGTALHATNSILEVLSSTFLNLFSNAAEGSIYLYESSSLTLKDSIFINSNSSIDSYWSSLSIKNSSFMNCSNSCIYGVKISLLASYSYFISSFGPAGGALYCSQCTNVSIISSNFSNNIAEKGGAIYITNQDEDSSSSQCSIDSSTFISNLASNGGAIWTNNVNLNISSSNFTENYSDAWETKTLQEIADGIGGAIKISCDNSETICYFNISSNNFSSNWATYKGGAISWDDSKPYFQDNYFWNNSAQYGNDIASFPVMMIFINDTNKRILQENSHLTLNSIASGQEKNPPISFALIDDISQIITTEVVSQAQLQSSSSDLIISGTSIVHAVNGIYHFKDYIISAKPGSSAKINVISSAIVESKANKSPNSLQISSKFLININLRLCEIGEATVGLDCESCLENYYNIDASNSKCLDCPSSAICYGNYTMTPKYGYWRDNKLTDKFWKCPYKPACLGSPDINNISFTGICKKGYESNMCHSCSEGYSRLYKNECQDCPSTLVGSFRLIGIFSVLVFMAIVIIKNSRKFAFESKSTSSVYLKIFWNYLQIMIIIATFNLNWPYEAVQFFYIQTCIDYIGAQLFSIGCFLQSSYSKEKIYYYKIVITSITPFSLAFILLLIWMVIYLIKKKNWRELKDDYISTFTVLLFLIHPSIIDTMFSIFSCKEINAREYWLNSDLGIRCWDYDHIFYAILFALPTINIWVIAAPALCFIKLAKNKSMLEDFSIKLRYGFLFNGYNAKHYYWEFLILYWKVILIALSVFLSNISTNIQAITVTLMLALFLHIQAKNEPYLESQFNKAEIFSRITSLVTILGGLFFITDDLDSVGEIIILIILLLVNFLFIIYIAIQLLWQISIFKKCFMILAAFLHINKGKKYKVRQDSMDLYGLNDKGLQGQERKIFTTGIQNSSIEDLTERDKEAASLELDPFSSEQSSLSHN